MSVEATGSADTKEKDVTFMQRALELAEQAAAQEEVPVGALLVLDGKVIGEGYNCPIGDCDPTAHAEIMALRTAARHQHNYRLPNATLYVSIEPCVMCLGAIMHARIRRVVFAATEPKAGALVSHPNILLQHNFNHQLVFEGGVLADQASQLIKAFFARRRRLKAQLKG